MSPDHARLGEALGAGSNDIFLLELVQHEGARHAADIGEREIAEQRGRKDDVGEDVAKRSPVTLDDRVEQIEPGDRGEGEFVADADAARAFGPSKPRVEDQQRNQAEPEDRHGIADQSDDANHLVDQCAALYGRQDPERHAEDRADDGAQRRQFDRRRKHPGDVGHDRIGRQHGAAEISGQRVLQIEEKLLVDRQVEPVFLARLRDHAFLRPVADNGQHRVDRDHPSDEEGHRQQPEIGDDDDADKADDPPGYGGSPLATPDLLCRRRRSLRRCRHFTGIGRLTPA